MTTEDPTQPNVLTFESPASWNTKYISPEGFECMLTLRGESGMDLLERVQGAISFLLKSGCQPCTRTNGYTKPTSGGNGSASWCPVHEVEMRRWEKDGKVWYSHKAGDHVVQWQSQVAPYINNGQPDIYMVLGCPFVL